MYKGVGVDLSICSSFLKNVPTRFDKPAGHCVCIGNNPQKGHGSVALVQGLHVRVCLWYYEYRQTIFKLIENAEEEGATGLNGAELCFAVACVNFHDLKAGA